MFQRHSWIGTALVVAGLLGLASAAAAQAWSRAPEAEETAYMIESMAPLPATSSNIAEARNRALLPVLRSGSVGVPVFWKFLVDGRYLFKGTAVIDAPVPGHAGCYFITYYGYGPDDAADEDIVTSMACRGAGGEWRFSNSGAVAGRIPRTLSAARKCPAMRSSCTQEEGLIEHTRTTPTRLRADYLAAASAPRQVASAPVAPPAPRPSPPAPPPAARAPPTASESLTKIIEEVVSQDAASWRLTEYVYGSVQNVRLLSGGGDTFVATADYYSRTLLTDSRKGWVKVVFKKGKLSCLEFWDQPGVCRPLGYSLTTQMAAANASAPIRPGESNEAARRRLEGEHSALAKEYTRVAAKMKKEVKTDRVAACKTSKELLVIADKMVATQSSILSVWRYKEQQDFLEQDRIIRAQTLEISSLYCK